MYKLKLDVKKIFFTILDKKSNNNKQKTIFNTY